MKTLRLYTIFLLLSVASVAFAVMLPSQSYYAANELYGINEDIVETEAGTKIRNINMSLKTGNSQWGNECWSESFEDRYKCQDCCGEKLDAAEEAEGPSEATDVLYDTCMETCNATSLPLGSVLCILPFALVYGVLKRYKKNKE